MTTKNDITNQPIKTGVNSKEYVDNYDSITWSTHKPVEPINQSVKGSTKGKQIAS